MCAVEAAHVSGASETSGASQVARGEEAWMISQLQDSL